MVQVSYHLAVILFYVKPFLHACIQFNVSRLATLPGGFFVSNPIETDALRIYLSQLEDYPILTRKEENLLATRYKTEKRS